LFPSVCCRSLAEPGGVKPSPAVAVGCTAHPVSPPPQDPSGSCRACPPGTFSLGDASCAAHTQCRAGNRVLLAAGTAASDSRCGACLPG
uniref:TNFR-Cys domain-containing protein n=1 Tax=Junco hyemalis TaxID=40217 RepID=A0A8C5JN82_JUNHY